MHRFRLVVAQVDAITFKRSSYRGNPDEGMVYEAIPTMRMVLIRYFERSEYFTNYNIKLFEQAKLNPDPRVREFFIKKFQKKIDWS